MLTVSNAGLRLVQGPTSSFDLTPAVRNKHCKGKEYKFMALRDLVHKCGFGGPRWGRNGT